jgi:hypothetical protein
MKSKPQNNQQGVPLHNNLLFMVPNCGAIGLVILLVHFMPEWIVDGQLYSTKNSPVQYFGGWVPDSNKCQTIKRRIE